MVLDKNLRLSKSLHLFDNSTPTLIFNSTNNLVEQNTEYIQVDFNKNLLHQITNTLHTKNCLSLIVEGGKQVLETFIAENLWDEAHVYIGNKNFRHGIPAPTLDGSPLYSETMEMDKLEVYKNKN